MRVAHEILNIMENKCDSKYFDAVAKFHWNHLPVVKIVQRDRMI